MLVTVNDRAVLSGRLCFPLAGAWHFTGKIDSPDVPTGAVTISGPGLALTGAIVRAAVFRGTLHARIVGGAGKLAADVVAAPYRDAPVRLLAGDVLREAGETLSKDSDASTLAAIVPRWLRAAGPAAAALWAIVDDQGATWRVQDNGQVWIGPDTWPTSPLEGLATEISADEAQGVATLAADTCSLRPGTTLGGRRVAFVEYSFAATGARIEVEYGSN